MNDKLELNTVLWDTGRSFRKTSAHLNSANVQYATVICNRRSIKSNIYQTQHLIHLKQNKCYTSQAHKQWCLSLLKRPF